MDENKFKNLPSNPSNVKFDKKLPKSYQSADSFFHFMNKFEYLAEILCDKKIYPRYCKESLELFDISISEVMILMKCFCDIPLHQVNRHKKEYGDICIGLTKEWGVRSGLQPVIYYNPNSEYPISIKKSFNSAMNYVGNEELLDDITEILNMNLKYQKYIKGKDLKTGKVKDFGDEKEWRYVPSISNDLDFSEIITSSSIINNELLIEEFNKKIKGSKYCIEFEYSDIKYLFVKTKKQKKQLIKLIMNLDIGVEKRYDLLTKIGVWKEVERDF